MGEDNKDNNDVFKDLESSISELIKYRKKHLLIIYYASNRSPTGKMIVDDTDILNEEFKNNNFNPEKTKTDLDIIIHSLGGDPSAAYLMGQQIRFFTEKVDILIPSFAYSAATLFTFCGDKMCLANNARLSPIDISWVVGKDVSRSVELINIDYFLKFVGECRESIEKVLNPFREEYGFNECFTTDVDSALLTEITNQVSAITIGKFFRERTLTSRYAEVLLESYLLKKVPPQVRKELVDYITKKLVFECPAHEFEIDFNLARKMNMPVELMSMKLTELTNNIIENLKKLEINGNICPYVGRNNRIPFIKIYQKQN